MMCPCALSRLCALSDGQAADTDHYCRCIFDSLLSIGLIIPWFLFNGEDVKGESIDLVDESLKFKGISENKEYEVDIVFLKPVDAEGSTYKVLPRSVQMHVMKKEKDEEEFWPRLLKDKALEKNQVKVDWDRYVDEDEEEEGFDTSALDGGQGMGGMGGMDMASMMAGMGGGGMGDMPGMGGMNDGLPPGVTQGMDMESLMKQVGDLDGASGTGGGPDSDDNDDDDDLPDLEES